MCLSSSGLRARVAARLVHFGCGKRPFLAMRSRLVSRAHGDVVEIGFGSGLNLPHYRPDQVSTLVGIEPDSRMLALAAPSTGAAGIQARIVQARGETIPLPDASADTVVLGYVLCTVDAPSAVLAEARRLLKPGGQLLFCEHAAAAEPLLRELQRILNRLWAALAGGCRLDRDPLGPIRTAGFHIREVRRERFCGPLRLLGQNIGWTAQLKPAGERNHAAFR